MTTPLFDMRKFGDSRWTKSHPRRVYTHGATQPVLTVLDVNGFDLHDLFLMGINDRTGRLIVPTESRAENAAAALEPAYETEVLFLGQREGCDLWGTDYTQRDPDGVAPSAFIVGLTLNDGRQVMKDGRWVTD